MKELDFEALFDASPNSYVLLDRELRLVTANRAYLELTASKLEELRGRPILEAFPHDPADPDNRATRMLRASLERVFSTGQRDAIAFIPYRIPRAQGGELEERSWSATHTPLFDDAGNVAFVLQHTVEVTDLERPERADDHGHARMQAGLLDRAQEVQAKNELLGAEIQDLRRLFDQAPGFICYLRGPSLVFELANEACKALVGQRDLLGKRLVDVMPELEPQGYMEMLRQVLGTGRPQVGRAMRAFVQRNGVPEEAFVDFVLQPISDASGSVVGIFVQGNDITERKRAEAAREKLESERMALLDRAERAREEAERANRLKDEFLATVSHELRTPLTSILGWVHIMRGGNLPEDRHARALETIERNARAQAQLVEDLLDVSRIINGKLQLQVENVDVVAVLEAALESVRPAAQAKSLEIELASPEAARVSGDATRLQQIMWNLLANAVKFTPAGGRISVTIRAEEDPVEVTVTDNGQGIASDFLPYVFDRFRQAEGSAARRHGGLGLGLAIVRHLVELHGGTIEVASEGIRKGATFTLRLPAARIPTPVSPHPAVSSPSQQVLPRLDGLSVLVVDDEADTCELLREIFEAQGIAVTSATSSAEGFEAFRRVRPDVVVTDIGMPGEDGYGLLHRIRALSPEDGGRTPTVALTAFARGEDRTRALLAGFRAHVPKPIDTAELVAVVASLAPAST
ncbi:MAG: hybrid sensor histidine kinase/response regulator [Polyangiales bacterium]